MKYLKLYENYKPYQVMDEDEYFNKILFGYHFSDDVYEDSDYIMDNWEAFTIEEINEITGISDKIKNYSINVGLNPIYPKAKMDIMNVQIDNVCINDFFIVKLKDEWYYVQICSNILPNIYYKCDQLSGLISCMSQYFS